jgi:DNA (cytosine-5)-methyltransferase 1
VTAYYNEIDPYAAKWLRNLIKAGYIAPGVVDERSIEDVKPEELAEFAQCHFFAGIGTWSLALRQADWPDSRKVWTASCPCQPFSTAGEGFGFADERHLWPTLYWLIEECKPPVVIGEQVANKAVDPWIDLVQADLEAVEYAFGAVPFPSAGVGAPHVRDRIYWIGQLADAEGFGCQGHRRIETRQSQRGANQRGPTNGFWSGSEWIKDSLGRLRAVEPGSFPLVNGYPSRVEQVRAYGNAINAEAAKTFIECLM